MIILVHDEAEGAALICIYHYLLQGFQWHFSTDQVTSGEKTFGENHQGNQSFHCRFLAAIANGHPLYQKQNI